MDRYLRKDLSVSPNQIIILRNREATRSAIIHAFRALRDNSSINPLDPIVIYYAGHGSEMDTPDGRKIHGAKSQCIIPQDVGQPDESGNLSCPIPDYTLAALLYELAEVKGNNIVSPVVFRLNQKINFGRILSDSYL
jgi:hypothetical protein